MCDYQHEYSFVFEDSCCESGDVSMIIVDNGFESMWQQIGEELRHEQEMGDLDQLFQHTMRLSPQIQMEQMEWKF
ncbi:uncharacterized protein Dwil_GK20810 [Drosophila willistoni]|uniref:Uncharacterized protein n=1 Tax=Drosophila willistoni TaxID=7260 RepID=B4MJH1_DROWI|nr:uncharacterized protein LOC6638285 [Drosophila willistoni]EDW72260.1 uncharacterized protein Dwil_GK20810 [Drosophila willistoni]